MKYYSPEWIQAVKEKSNTDEAYLAKTNNLTVTFEDLIEDCPGGVDILVRWTLENGKVTDVVRTEKPAPSDWRKQSKDKDIFERAAGPYEAWAKMNRGELSPIVAMTKKVYKIQGNMLKIMSKFASLTAHSDMRATIPVEY